MAAVTKDIYIEQGATFFLGFTWYDGPDTTAPPKDLTGWVARMQVRRTQGTPPLVDASSEVGNGKITLGGATGRIEVKLSDEDTDLMDAKSALYDLEVEDPAGDVYRLLQGKVTISPNITQEDGTEPVVTE